MSRTGDGQSPTVEVTRHGHGGHHKGDGIERGDGKEKKGGHSAQTGDESVFDGHAIGDLARDKAGQNATGKDDEDHEGRTEFPIEFRCSLVLCQIGPADGRHHGDDKVETYPTQQRPPVDAFKVEQITKHICTPFLARLPLLMYEGESKEVPLCLLCGTSP